MKQEDVRFRQKIPLLRTGLVVQISATAAAITNEDSWQWRIQER